MTIDNQIHNVANTLQNEYFVWQEFVDIVGQGRAAEQYAWYYAEMQLYVILEKVTGAFCFIKARSPREAWQKLIDQIYGQGDDND